MNVWTATISDIQPIPNKDRIVLATVNGYQSIVAAKFINPDYLTRKGGTEFN